MGLNTLTDRASGQTIQDTFFNDIHQALKNDFIGRDASGVPAANQNLGTIAFPWGTIRGNALVINGASVDVSQVATPAYRVVGGQTRSTCNQPAFLRPAGSAGGAQVTIEGSVTPLSFDIGGTNYTVSTDINISGLSVAPGTNNTALINNSDAADQDDTRYWGEPEVNNTIVIDTVGSEISSRVGSYQAFELNGEILFGYINSTTEITNCYRGFFVDDSLAPINRAVFSDNDVLTLLRVGYVFVDADGLTAEVTNTAPSYSQQAPTSPSTGDYWFQINNNVWTRYDGVSFVPVDRTFIGLTVMDTSDCIGARSVDFDFRPNSLSTLSILQDFSNEEINASSFGKVYIYGQEIAFETDFPVWNITTDLTDNTDLYNATEQNSTWYYLYITDEGDTEISDIRPYYRGDLGGWYAPHQPHRCVGSCYNNAAGNIEQAGTFGNSQVPFDFEVALQQANGYGSANNIRRWTNIVRRGGSSARYFDNTTDGGQIIVDQPGIYIGGYSDQFNTTRAIGITINANPATGINLLPASERLIAASTSAANNIAAVSTVFIAKKGDIISAYSQNQPSGVNTWGENFFVTRIG